MAAGSAPGTARMEPSSASSPIAANPETASGEIDAHGDEQAEHDCQIVVAAFLGKIGGGEVHRQMLVGQAEADGVERIANPLAAFGDGFVGETDDVKSRISRRDADLNFHRAGLNAHERQRRNLAVHAHSPGRSSETTAGFGISVATFSMPARFFSMASQIIAAMSLPPKALTWRMPGREVTLISVR